MSHLREICRLEVPAELVFELALRAERLPDWSPVVAEVRDASGRLDLVGATFTVALAIAGRRLDLTAEVAEVRRPDLLRIRGSDRGGGRYDWTLRCQAAGTGTLATVDIDYELPNLPVPDEPDRLRLERSIEDEVRRALDEAIAAIDAAALQRA